MQNEWDDDPGMLTSYCESIDYQEYCILYTNIISLILQTKANYTANPFLGVYFICLQIQNWCDCQKGIMMLKKPLLTDPEITTWMYSYGILFHAKIEKKIQLEANWTRHHSFHGIWKFESFEIFARAQPLTDTLVSPKMFTWSPS